MGRYNVDYMRRLRDYENNCIPETMSVMDALNRLDEVQIKVLFVVDKEDKVIASLTDGDIRRAILKGTPLDSDAKAFARRNPLTMRPGDESRISDELKRRKLEIVPILDGVGRIIGMYTDEEATDISIDKVSVPVVLMAGGKGTRLYPYTRILPKPLIPIEDIPISERIMNSFAKVGCNEFYMIVNYKRNMIKSYFSENPRDYEIRFIDESEPLGTGGGLKLLESDIEDTFILSNCDILIMTDIAKLIKHHKESGSKATMVCSLKNFEIPYGIVHISEGGDIESMEEKPTMSFLTNTGYYVLEKEVFQYIDDNERIGMPDILQRMQRDGLKVGVYPISENAWLDMGQFDSMDSMERRLREIENNAGI